MKWFQVKPYALEVLHLAWNYLLSCERKIRNSHPNQVHLNNNHPKFCWNKQLIWYYYEKEGKPWIINHFACMTLHICYKRIVLNQNSKAHTINTILSFQKSKLTDVHVGPTHFVTHAHAWTHVWKCEFIQIFCMRIWLCYKWPVL